MIVCGMQLVEITIQYRLIKAVSKLMPGPVYMLGLWYLDKQSTPVLKSLPNPSLTTSNHHME